MNIRIADSAGKITSAEISRETHKVHRQHDDDRNDDGDQQVAKPRLRAGRPCETLVKGHGKDLIVKQDEHRHDQHRHSHAQPYLCGRQRQNGGGAEQRAAHIAGKIGRGGENVHQKIADGKRPHRDHGDGGVALDFRVLPCTQKRYCTDNRNDHHQRHFIGDLQHGGNAHVQ